MKSTYLALSLLSIATLSIFGAIPVHQVNAQCVVNDTSVQVSINGSRIPTERRNNVNQNSTGGCVGNTINTTGVQVQTGGNKPAIQSRTVNQTINGNNNSPTGINSSPVKTRTNIGIDVYNPANR